MQKLINEAAEKLDKQLNFKKIIGGLLGVAVEWFDLTIVKGALTWAYNKLSKEYHDEYEILLKAYISDDYSKVSFELATRLNKAIDLPLLDEEEEGIIFNSIFTGLSKVAVKRALTISTQPEPSQGPDEPRG